MPIHVEGRQLSLDKFTIRAGSNGIYRKICSISINYWTRECWEYDLVDLNGRLVPPAGLDLEMTDIKCVPSAATAKYIALPSMEKPKREKKLGGVVL